MTIIFCKALDFDKAAAKVNPTGPAPTIHTSYMIVNKINIIWIYNLLRIYIILLDYSVHLKESMKHS